VTGTLREDRATAPIERIGFRAIRHCHAGETLPPGAEDAYYCRD
jgi:hypothetical protein